MIDGVAVSPDRLLQVSWRSWRLASRSVGSTRSASVSTEALRRYPSIAATSFRAGYGSAGVDRSPGPRGRLCWPSPIRWTAGAAVAAVAAGAGSRPDRAATPRARGRPWRPRRWSYLSGAGSPSDRTPRRMDIGAAARLQPRRAPPGQLRNVAQQQSITTGVIQPVFGASGRPVVDDRRAPWLVRRARQRRAALE